MRLDAVAGCRVRRVRAESAIILHFSQNSIEFGLEEHTHQHTPTHTQLQAHSNIHTHTLSQGGNVNKMDRVKCVCGALLRCAAACATFAALHYTGFSAPRHIRFNSPPISRFPSSTAPRGSIERRQAVSAVVQNIIWHCILSSVFFWRN